MFLWAESTYSHRGLACCAALCDDGWLCSVSLPINVINQELCCTRRDCDGETMFLFSFSTSVYIAGMGNLWSTRWLQLPSTSASVDNGPQFPCFCCTESYRIPQAKGWGLCPEALTVQILTGRRKAREIRQWVLSNAAALVSAGDEGWGLPFRRNIGEGKLA